MTWKTPQHLVWFSFQRKHCPPPSNTVVSPLCGANVFNFSRARISSSSRHTAAKTVHIWWRSYLLQQALDGCTPNTAHVCDPNGPSKSESFGYPVFVSSLVIKRCPVARSQQQVFATRARKPGPHCLPSRFIAPVLHQAWPPLPD